MEIEVNINAFAPLYQALYYVVIHNLEHTYTHNTDKNKV